MMPLRQRKIYIIQVNSKQNKFETERIPQLITEKNSLNLHLYDIRGGYTSRFTHGHMAVDHEEAAFGV